jgi:hypothetical protein
MEATMADTPDRGPEDGKRVNVNQPHEIAYWTKRFGCSEAQLRAAVKAVGVMVSDVERELKRR